MVAFYLVSLFILLVAEESSATRCGLRQFLLLFFVRRTSENMEAARRR